MHLNHKAQIFTWDLILATAIFLIVLATILSLWTDTIEDLEVLDTSYEMDWLATTVAEQLARTPGSPLDWTNAPNIYNITVIGLADTRTIGNDTRIQDRVIDPDKLISFINLTKGNGYASMRNKLFGTGKYDFYIEISCLDPATMDCFEGLKLDNTANYNITCNESNTTLYISDYTMKSDPYLAGIWRFDEGTGNTSEDASAGNNDLSLHTTTWTEGKYGSALSFNSINSYAGSPTMNISRAYTVALWAKVSDNSIRTMLSTSGPKNYGFDLKFQNGNEIHADIGNGTSWITHYANATFLYDLNRWYYIVYAVNQTGYRIYINSTLIRQGAYASNTPKLLDENHTLEVGRKHDATEYYYGAIDELKIWNKALSNDEIAKEYEHGNKYCRFGKNTPITNTSYQILDTKTVTFGKGKNESIYDDDTTILEPTANLKIVLYRNEI